MKTYQQLWQSLTPLYETGEAQAIVRTVLDVKYGMTLTDIICGKVNELSADEERNLEEIVERLQNGEPVQYVLGKADFAGRTFHVEPGVLIPRPETAELCEWMAKSASPQPRIMDLCTGSGCIAITLSLEIPNSEVLGIDISDCACRIATENAKLLSSKACFEKMDVFKLLERYRKDTKDSPEVDMIVSNPPYICEKEKIDMAKNVLDYEPGIALFVPDEDPLKFYRAIAEIASIRLRCGGFLYFEINPIYEKETREMLDKMKKWELPEDAIARNMEFLIQKKFVDDERFARFFINDKIKYNKWGRRKVEQALWLKHISREISDPIFAEIEDELYMETLLPLMRNKYKTIKAKNDYERSMKLIRFALGRGFSMDIIRKCIDKMGVEDVEF